MINSVHKAMKILSILADAENRAVSLSQISERAGINKSTCSHIVSTLAADGYVQRVSHTLGYVPGPEVYYLTRFGKYDDSLVSVCRPVLRWMYKKSGYTVVLAVIQNEKKFIIDSLDDEHRIFARHEEIRKDDIYRTATGRVMLANMRESELKKIYEKYGNPKPEQWQGVTSYESLKKALGLCGKRSIVSTFTSDENQHSRGYAGGIFKSGSCIGAVGIALKTDEGVDEFTAESEKQLIKILSKGIAEINRRLSYS